MKYFQFVLVLGAFFILVFLRSHMLGDDEQPVIVGNSQSTSNITSTPSPGDNSSQSPSSQTQVGQYKDGTYTGSVEDAYYGNYQVAAVISGGKISDIKFLEYPNDNPTSVSINTQAAVFLKSEAIQAQSANVDIVSGASQSSEAFQRSLQNGLNQAK